MIDVPKKINKERHKNKEKNWVFIGMDIYHRLGMKLWCPLMIFKN